MAINPDVYKKFVEASEKGDMHAQNTLGWAYLYMPDLLDFNLEKGIYYLELAANQDQENALCTLGWIYCLGEFSIKKDFKKGVSYLERSSVLGFAIASYNLGLFYYAGYESFKRDLNKAKENWKKCYIQHPKADPQLNLDDISKEIDSFAAKPTEEMTLLKSTFLSNLKKTIRN